MTTVRHIPVCPFPERLEILLVLRGRTDGVESRVVDITRWIPRKKNGRHKGAQVGKEAETQVYWVSADGQSSRTAAITTA